MTISDGLCRVRIFVVLVFGTSLLSSCGDVVDLPLDVTGGVPSLAVSPDSATVRVGQQIQMTGKARIPSGDSTVVWSVKDSGIAAVSATGIVTGIAAGSATVVAQAKADLSVSGAAKVVVIP